MIARLTVIAVMLFSTFASASGATSIPLLSIEGANWTTEESNYIRELHRKGSIKIATKISSSVYVPLEDGTATGFHYNVLKAFADLAAININVKLVDWNDYFYKEGGDLERVKSDPSYTYVPALLETVDLYVDGITQLAWREKMFDIIKYIPSRHMVVCRKNNMPAELVDLDNKVFAMIEHTSMHQNLEKISKTHGLNFRYTLAQHFDDMDRMVAQGEADFTVYDSDRAFAALARFKNLTLAWPVSAPEIMGWAVHKNNRILKDILDKYIKYAQETGILDKFWKISYGVTFIEYLRILNLGT